MEKKQGKFELFVDFKIIWILNKNPRFISALFSVISSLPLLPRFWLFDNLYLLLFNLYRH